MRVPRGFSLLMAMGMVAVFTVAALLSLTYVAQSNEVQGQSRRAKEAFFAAQAGLAEAKEKMRILAGPGGAGFTYTAVMAAGPLPTGVGPLPYSTLNPDHPQPAPPDNEWYQVIPQTSYGLPRSGAGVPYAIDDTVPGANREMNGPGGAAFLDYPDQTNVSYRVFLRDDFDETPPTPQDQTIDRNGFVWLISIGQVTQTGGRPIQSVVTALITNGNVPAGVLNGTSQRITNLTSAESGIPAAGAVNLN